MLHSDDEWNRTEIVSRKLEKMERGVFDFIFIHRAALKICPKTYNPVADESSCRCQIMCWFNCQTANHDVRFVNKTSKLGLFTCANVRPSLWDFFLNITIDI